MNAPPSPSPQEGEQDRKLTIKQQKFIDAYIQTGNGAEAARQAGYSEQTARFIASENLTKPYMIDAIDKRRDQLMQDSENKLERYLRQLEAESVNQDNSDSSRVRSLELLIKAHGGFIERTESVVYNGSFLADLDLSDDDEESEAPENDSKTNDLH